MRPIIMKMTDGEEERPRSRSCSPLPTCGRMSPSLPRRPASPVILSRDTTRGRTRGTSPVTFSDQTLSTTVTDPRRASSANEQVSVQRDSGRASPKTVSGRVSPKVVLGRRGSSPRLVLGGRSSPKLSLSGRSSPSGRSTPGGGAGGGGAEVSFRSECVNIYILTDDKREQQSLPMKAKQIDDKFREILQKRKSKPFYLKLFMKVWVPLLYFIYNR